MSSWLAQQRSRVRSRVVRSLAQLVREVTNADRTSPIFAQGEQLAVAAAAKTAGCSVLVHFAGQPANLYQLRDWLGPLEALNEAHGVLIVARDQDTFEGLVELTHLPAMVARSAGELEVVVDNAQFKVALYVNQHNWNFMAFRYADMLHVNVGHGESDKLYMASNQAKAYDFMFVAGQAALDRYRAHLINFDEGRLIRIGRPQLDFAKPSMEPASRPTVLYAPTWEGDRQTMRYSSITSMSSAILTELLAPDSGLRVVFRPHPFTGSKDPQAAAALKEAQELVTAAIKHNPDIGHCENVEDDFLSLAAGADVLISDNSAVLTDFLAMDKPFFVTIPDVTQASLPAGGVWEAGYQLEAAKLSGLAVRVSDVLNDDPLSGSRLALANYYYDARADGDATRAFVQAVGNLITKRDQMVATRDQHMSRQDHSA